MFSLLSAGIGYISIGSHGLLQPSIEKGTKDISVSIPKGLSVMGISFLLHEKKLIPSPYAFAFMAYGLDRAHRIQAGHYHFETGMTPFEILQKMVRGSVENYTITIPEGWSVARIVELLNDHPHLSGPKIAMPQEGVYFPGTFSYTMGQERQKLSMLMKKEMDKKIEKLLSAYPSHAFSTTPEKFLILASIVEKETANPLERARIAGVFINRLNKGMRLQSCPTVIYAITQGKESLGRPLLLDDLKINSPFNTYKNKGLPPSPICCPGWASLKAVAEPEIHDYFYFVANAQGSHTFSKTYHDHQNHKKKLKQSA
jgi:UPF0755 protein